MNSNKLCLVMTATIKPGVDDYLKRADPELRRDDYEKSLKLWLNNLKKEIPICLVENSASDLSNLRKIGKKSKNDCEFLSFDGHSFPKEKGKGYGEMKALEYAVLNSRVIGKADYFVKVTGRYFVENSRYFFEHIAAEELYVMADLKRRLSFSDSRIFGGRKEFLEEYLIPRKKELNDSRGIYMEHALAKSTLEAILDSRKWDLLPQYPHIRGVSGTSGKRYGQGILKRIYRYGKNKVKRLII